MLSAFGFLAADVQNEFARTYLQLGRGDARARDVGAAVESLIDGGHAHG